MNNKGKQKSFSDKIYILHKLMHILEYVLNWHHTLRLLVSMLNTTVKNREESDRRYVQCGTSCKQQNLLQHLLLEKLETALASSKHVRVILSQMAPTSRWRPCTSPLARNTQLFGFQWMDQ
jgi:hypothetical protein